MIPQLLGEKLPGSWCLADEKDLHARLVHTVWEPRYLDTCPGLLDAPAVVHGMQALFQTLPIPTSVWDGIARALGRLDLRSLQAYTAWQKRRGCTGECLGPHPLLAQDRATVFAGLSGQRWSSEATRGLDPLLPPGLGKDFHLAEAQLLPDPFHSRPWPEEDVQFVIEAVKVWRSAAPVVCRAPTKSFKASG